MHVRFPTYSLRELQRPHGATAEGDDSFIQIIGNLGTDTEQDLNRHSRQAGLANPEEDADGENRPPQQPHPGAAVIAAVVESADATDGADAPREERLIGRMLDIRA